MNDAAHPEPPSAPLPLVSAPASTFPAAMRLLLLASLLSTGLVSAALLDPKAQCKLQLSLYPNPSQLCYQILKATPPNTVTVTKVGPKTTTSTCVTSTAPAVFTTVATVTAATPTETSSFTEYSTTYTFSLTGNANGRRDLRGGAEEKRQLSASLVALFGQSVVNQACFEVVYGGQTPTTTKTVPGPTITSTSTLVTTPTSSVTATVTPAPTTTSVTTTLTTTSTVTYRQTYHDYCYFNSSNDPNRQDNQASSPEECAQLCVDQHPAGTCTDFGFWYGTDRCFTQTSPFSLRGPGEGIVFQCVVYEEVA